MNEKIDFVMIWVDGSDKEWLKEKMKYSGMETSSASIDSSAARYRDWENLQYWFRGVEKFAPWVNKIHFVTSGQIPDWLDLTNPKLNHVKHEDYIPKEYLPTFSSHPIELNLHRIKGLSEKFVYFNDDMFFTKEVSSSSFFGDDNLPKYRAILNAIIPSGNKNNPMPSIEFNNISVINRHFNKISVIKKNPQHWLNLKYGLGANIRTLFNLPYSGFTGFYSDHLPAPLLKSTFREVWKNEPEILNEVSSRRFRSDRDVNQYLLRTWQMCKGEFEPMRIKNFGKAFFLPDRSQTLKDAIENQKYNVLCINDSDDIDSFKETKRSIIDSFEKILPEKSSFEL